MKEKNRWYDEIAEISDLFELIKGKDKKERDDLLINIKNIIMESDAELIDKHVMEFPLDFRRRWYDKDPFLWLIVNALKYADDELIGKVVEYYKEKSKK